MRSSSRFIGTAVALVAVLSIAGGVAASSTVVVRPGDVGTSWLASNRNGGSSAFVTGPATAPLGVGSLQFTTTGLPDASQLFDFGYIGTPLANLDTLGYSEYRSSASTNNEVQRIAFAVQVEVDGPGPIGTTTLIFEPVYQTGIWHDPMPMDTWQAWDALRGGNAIWWSTRDLPNGSGGFVACNPNATHTEEECGGKRFIPLSSILAAFPNAVVAGGIGPFVGSGWAGQFTGYTDAVRIGVSGNTTTYDFEPQAPPEATPTPDGTTLVGGETATPVRAATPPPTSATGESSSDSGPTPLVGLLICVAFGSLGLLAAEAQRRMMRR